MREGGQRVQNKEKGRVQGVQKTGREGGRECRIRRRVGGAASAGKRECKGGSECRIRRRV